MTLDENIAMTVRLDTAMIALRAALAVAANVDGAPATSIREALSLVLGCQLALRHAVPCDADGATWRSLERGQGQ